MSAVSTASLHGVLLYREDFLNCQE